MVRASRVILENSIKIIFKKNSRYFTRSASDPSALRVIFENSKKGTAVVIMEKAPPTARPGKGTANCIMWRRLSVEEVVVGGEVVGEEVVVGGVGRRRGARGGAWPGRTSRRSSVEMNSSCERER
jgi:hypothetical protein